MKALVKESIPCSGIAQVLCETDSSDDDIETTKPVHITDIAKCSFDLTDFKHRLRTTYTSQECAVISAHFQRSKDWFANRVGRLTSSLFGKAKGFKDTSDASPLVAAVMGRSEPVVNQYMQYGIDREAVARTLYIDHQRSQGHRDLHVQETGLIINSEWPHLGSSPDGMVKCTCCGEGLLEIKCCASRQDLTPKQVALDPTYPSVYLDESDCVALKPNSHWFSQVQGQMAICHRPWCDFVFYTNRGISVSRVHFDAGYWEDMLQKLSTFYDKYIFPALTTQSLS